jgi:hypothetical protein
MDLSKIKIGRLGDQQKLMRECMGNVIKYKQAWLMNCGITDCKQLDENETFDAFKSFLIGIKCKIKKKHIKYSAEEAETRPGIIYIFNLFCICLPY